MAKKPPTEPRKPTAKPSMPDVLYVVKGAEGVFFGYPSFAADNDLGDGDVVGIYHRYGVRRLTVTRTLR